MFQQVKKIKLVCSSDILLFFQNEARVNNHQEVIEEDKQNKLPANWEARQMKAEWLTNDDKLRQEAKEKVY